MTAAKVRLNPAEFARIENVLDKLLLAGPAHELQPVVESIVAARIAEALNEAAEAWYNGDTDTSTAVTDWLREVADEYAPRADS